MKNELPFKQLNKLIQSWQKSFFSAELEENDDRARLERLMLQILPKQWQIRAVSAGIEDGVWTLCVQNSIDAHQLRFLSYELELKLSEHIPYAPKIHVRVDPTLWQKRSATILPPVTLYQRHYSDEEAEAILTAFYTPQKPTDTVKLSE